MLIRPAEIEDMPILVDLIRRSFKDVARRFELNRKTSPTHPSFYTAERMASDFEKNIEYFLLEEKAAPAGCVALEKATPETCYLERLGVLPEKRGNGFGKALVEHVLKQARTFGARQTSIGIIADDLELKSWYETIGFVEKDTREFKHLPFRVTFMEVEL